MVWYADMTVSVVCVCVFVCMPNNERERPADGCGLKFNKCLSVCTSDRMQEWTYF